MDWRTKQIQRDVDLKNQREREELSNYAMNERKNQSFQRLVKKTIEPYLVLIGVFVTLMILFVFWQTYPTINL